MWNQAILASKKTFIAKKPVFFSYKLIWVNLSTLREAWTNQTYTYTSWLNSPRITHTLKYTHQKKTLLGSGKFCILRCNKSSVQQVEKLK